MDKWFHKLNRFVRVILLLIPPIGMIIDIIVRWSHVIRKASALNVIMALLVTFTLGAWSIIDSIWTLLFGRMIGYR
ncbi:MAG: hypothetical protein J6R47_06980 [Acholeplasmatales bacterium]|nr:hypothetical protein [Acholeplasmatales bacterium]